NPRAAKHRRGAVAVGSAEFDRGFAQQARAEFARVLPRECDLAEFRPDDTEDSVVAGEPVIEECVIGREEIENAAIVGEDAADEIFRLRGKIAPELVAESGKE